MGLFPFRRSRANCCPLCPAFMLGQASNSAGRYRSSHLTLGMTDEEPACQKCQAISFCLNPKFFSELVRRIKTCTKEPDKKLTMCISQNPEGTETQGRLLVISQYMNHLHWISSYFGLRPCKDSSVCIQAKLQVCALECLLKDYWQRCALVLSKPL